MITFTLVILIAVFLSALSWYGGRRTEQANPPEGQYVRVGAARMHYRTWGEGTPLVCLHGASAHLGDFSASIAPMLANEFRVIAIDRPGMGYSERPGRGWWDPLDQANAIRGVLQTLGVERPILLGHSWSGALVMSYLLHYPREVSGAVLLSPATRSWYAPPALYNRISRWPVLGALFSHLLVYPVGSLMMDAGIRSVFRRGKVPPRYRERTGVDLLLRPGRWRFNADDLCLLNENLKRNSWRYHWIRHPLLTIMGDHDPIVSNEIHVMALRRQLPQLDIVSLADTGHAPHHENPEAVVKLIREFRSTLSVTNN